MRQFLFKDQDNEDYIDSVFAKTEEEAESIMIDYYVNVAGMSKKDAKEKYNDLTSVEIVEINKRPCESCGQRPATINLCKEC